MQFSSIDEIVDERVSARLLKPIHKNFTHCYGLFGYGYGYRFPIFGKQRVYLELIRRPYLYLSFRIAKLKHLYPKPVLVFVGELIGREFEWLEMDLFYVLLLLGPVDGHPLGEPVDL